MLIVLGMWAKKDFQKIIFFEIKNFLKVFQIDLREYEQKTIFPKKKNVNRINIFCSVGLEGCGIFWAASKEPND